MYVCTNCNCCQLQFSLCNGLCKYRHLVTFYLAIKGFSNASQAEQMWIWQTQFGRQETSTHMLILQQHKACKKQLCRYGSPNNCQEVPIVKGSKQLTSDYLEWKEQHLNRCNHGIPPEIFVTVNKSFFYNPAQNRSQDCRYLTEVAFDVDIKRWVARSKVPRHITQAEEATQH